MDQSKRRGGLGVLLAALCIAASGPAHRAVAGEVTLADDAYHYAQWADGQHDATYTEWWYFNLRDVRSGLHAILSYFVLDPGNVSGIGQAQMVSVAYAREGTVIALDLYPVTAFSASADRADVTIEGSTVRVVDDETYRVSGGSRDGRLSWDLEFVRQAGPWLAGDRIGVGALDWERMSWLLYMPRARVSGRMVVDGRVYDVSGPGYHDHNWGEWIPTDALWNWAQYADARVRFDMGVFIGREAGVVGVEVDGVRHVFEPGQYELMHTRWARDSENGVPYPVLSRLTAQSDEARLEVTLAATDTAALRGDLPPPLRDLIIYEQTARIDGVRSARNAQGAWAPVVRFHGPGFKEYTAKHR